MSSHMLLLPFDLAPTKQSELHLWLNHDASGRRVCSAPRFDSPIFWLWICQATNNRVELVLNPVLLDLRTLFQLQRSGFISRSRTFDVCSCYVMLSTAVWLWSASQGTLSCGMCGWARWKSCSVQRAAGAPGVHELSFHTVLYQFPSLHYISFLPSPPFTFLYPSSSLLFL